MNEEMTKEQMKDVLLLVDIYCQNVMKEFREGSMEWLIARRIRGYLKGAE